MRHELPGSVVPRYAELEGEAAGAPAVLGAMASAAPAAAVCLQAQVLVVDLRACERCIPDMGT